MLPLGYSKSCPSFRCTVSTMLTLISSSLKLFSLSPGVLYYTDSSPHSMIPSGYVYFLRASCISPTRLQALSLLFLCLPCHLKTTKPLAILLLYIQCNLHVNVPEGEPNFFCSVRESMGCTCEKERERERDCYFALPLFLSRLNSPFLAFCKTASS